MSNDPIVLPSSKTKGIQWWQTELSNPWQFRFQGADVGVVYTIATGEAWWAAVWDDLDSEHSKEAMASFWTAYSQEKHQLARERALGGARHTNWSRAYWLYNHARIEDYAATITATEDQREALEKHRELLLSDANREIIKKQLGEWLYSEIRSDRTENLDRLSKLIRGKAPPLEWKPPPPSKLKPSVPSRLISQTAIGSLLVPNYANG